MPLYLAIFDHETSKQHPSIWAALCHQGVSSPLHNVLHNLLLNLGCDSWSRGVCTHATRVGSSITLTNCFVILQSTLYLGMQVESCMGYNQKTMQWLLQDVMLLENQHRQRCPLVARA